MLQRVPVTMIPELRDVSVRSETPPLVPPPRFAATSFESYRPQHPSQHEALRLIRTLALESAAAGRRAARFQLPWRQPAVVPGHGVYLDGSFGVGKTHLLAAAFNASPAERKAYLSFQELVYLVGQLGLTGTRDFFRDLQFLCLDEYELDDPGNTLIIKSVLQFLFEQGTLVLTTSNTPPDAHGAGRFDAEHFKREIQSIAAHFVIVPLDGPDWRKRETVAQLTLTADLRTLLQDPAALPTAFHTSWADLFTVLRDLHPMSYRSLLADVGTLLIDGVSAIPGQSDALRFVHFIDKLYDLQVRLRASGEISLAALFAPAYRKGGYFKKHERCISRLSELLEEPLLAAGEDTDLPDREATAVTG